MPQVAEAEVRVSEGVENRMRKNAAENVAKNLENLTSDSVMKKTGTQSNFSPRYATFLPFFARYVTLSPACSLSPHIIHNYAILYDN